MPIAKAELLNTQSIAFRSFSAWSSFRIGELVTLEVDSKRRILNSRLHSAGHLIDKMCSNLLGWTPSKGYHFPQGSYVEYTGSLEDLDKESLKKDLESVCNNFIQFNLISSFLMAFS